MIDAVILTDNRYVNPEKTDWYIDQVLLEDKLLQAALEDKGLKVCKKDWADSNFSENAKGFQTLKKMSETPYSKYWGAPMSFKDYVSPYLLFFFFFFFILPYARARATVAKKSNPQLLIDHMLTPRIFRRITHLLTHRSRDCMQ